MCRCRVASTIFVCSQSTESDLSLESDDLATYTNVSFAEFLQQYKELSDWLNHIEAATKVNVSSLSEKYLNQVRCSGNVIVEINRRGSNYIVYYVVSMCWITDLKMLPVSDDFPCFGRGLKFCNLSRFFRINMKYHFQMPI